MSPCARIEWPTASSIAKPPAIQLGNGAPQNRSATCSGLSGRHGLCSSSISRVFCACLCGGKFCLETAPSSEVSWEQDSAVQESSDSSPHERPAQLIQTRSYRPIAVIPNRHAVAQFAKSGCSSLTRSSSAGHAVSAAGPHSPSAWDATAVLMSAPTSVTAEPPANARTCVLHAVSSVCRRRKASAMLAPTVRGP